MSYRKKHYPPKPRKQIQPEYFAKEVHNPGTLRDLPSNMITSGLPYQKPLNEREVQQLIEKWDDRLLEPLVVSFRDGRYNLIDGQHRLNALQKMNDGKAVTLACLIFTGMTYEEEAALYFKLDQGKKRLSMAQSIKAQLESRSDPALNEIGRLTGTVGFKWPVYKNRGGTNEITATRATVNAYELLGPDAFSRMLALLKNTWDGDPDSLTALMLSGAALLVKTYPTELNDRIFTQHLSVITPVSIIRRAKSDYSTNSNGLRCARVLLECYNKGCRGKFKLSYRFPG